MGTVFRVLAASVMLVSATAFAEWEIAQVNDQAIAWNIVLEGPHGSRKIDCVLLDKHENVLAHAGRYVRGPVASITIPAPIGADVSSVRCWA